MVVEGKETPMRMVGRIVPCIALVLGAIALGVAADAVLDWAGTGVGVFIMCAALGHVFHGVSAVVSAGGAPS